MSRKDVIVLDFGGLQLPFRKRAFILEHTFSLVKLLLLLGQDSHARRVREISLDNFALGWCRLVRFHFRDDEHSQCGGTHVWTVVCSEVFLGTFVELSETPVSLLRTLFISLFWVVCVDHLLDYFPLPTSS